MLLASVVGVHGQASKNITQIGHLPFPDDCADVVGYAAAGVEYALIGHESGVGIVSLANPANPTLLQDLPGVSTIWRELDVYQHYCYIVNEGGDGLRIVNLANLPGNVSYKDTMINGMNTGHTLYIEGNLLYIYGADIDNGGVSIFSLADPWRPQHIGQFTTRYVHDAYVRNGIGYLSQINDGYLEIVDLTNPNNPVSLGITTTPSNFTHNSWLNDAGTVCFTTDEVNAAYIAAYDITNPANPMEITRYRGSLSGGASIPHNVKVLNDFLVTAYYKDGVNIADASRPHNLIETGYYDTNPASGGGFDGVWGLECYLPSGRIIASDMTEGLFVLEPTYVRGCYLEGQVTDLNTSQAINGASITIQSTTIADLSDANGNYATGTADAGTYTVTYSKFGYQDSTITVNLSNGVLVTRNIPLRPLNRVSMTVNVVEQGTNNPIPSAAVLFVEASGSLQAPYTANGSGQVVDPNFIAGNYNVIAGKWGWVTEVATINATNTTNSITIALPVGYYDDFALDFGWGTQSNANSGDWVRDEPIGTFGGFGNQEFNPEDDITGDISDKCYVTGNGGGGIGDDDVDAGDVTLISPSMNLTTYQTPVLKYYRWFANGGGSGNPNDSLIIEIDNGLSTVVLRRVSGIFSNSWQQDSFIVSNFITVTQNMHVRFIAGDYPQGHVVEAAVDGFEVVDRGAVGVKDPLDNGSLLTVYPNPINARSVVYYDLKDSQSGSFELRDMMGRQVFSKPLSKTAGQFDLNLDLPAGTYIGSLHGDNGFLKSIKLVR